MSFKRPALLGCIESLTRKSACGSQATNPFVLLQLYQTTGLYAVTALRWTFDKATRYGPQMNESKWMTRVLFLETIAGVHFGQGHWHA